MKAEITFAGTLQQRRFSALIELTVTGDQWTVGEAREMLVRMAIQITNPETLDRIALDLAEVPASERPAGLRESCKEVNDKRRKIRRVK